MSNLFIMAGVAGSGKSALAPFVLNECKKRNLNLTPLDPDILYGPMERTLLTVAGVDPNDRDSNIFKLLARPARYEGLWNASKFLLDHGCDVLLIAPFSKEAKEGVIKQNALKQIGTQHHVGAVWIYASESVRRQRIIARARPEDAVKLENWEQYESSLPSEKVIDGIEMVKNEGSLEDSALKVLSAWNVK